MLLFIYSNLSINIYSNIIIILLIIANYVNIELFYILRIILQDLSGITINPTIKYDVFILLKENKIP
jgi:hypothetical protein